MSARPLAGRTVLVTRAAEDAERWAGRLVELGARAVVMPCLDCEWIADAGTAGRLRSAIASADWLLVASRRGAEAVARLLEGRLPARIRVAALGPASAAAARESLGRVDLVADEPASRGLGRALVEHERRSGGTRVVRAVVAGAAGGREEAEAELVAGGIEVTRVAVYRTVPTAPVGAKRDLIAEGVDSILLASPSAVTGLLNRALPPRAARVITIGPTTSAAARAAGLTVAAEARRPDLESMLEAIS